MKRKSWVAKLQVNSLAGIKTQDLWKWQSTPEFLPGKPMDRGASSAIVPWGYKELDVTWWLKKKKVYTHNIYIGLANKSIKIFPQDVRKNQNKLFFGQPNIYIWSFLVAQLVNNLPEIWESWVRSLGWEDPLEKGTAFHSSTLAWRIP